jgi:hypothetical protein
VPKIDVADPTPDLEALVDADLDTLATALYARADDVLKAAPERAPWRPLVGIEPQICDAELVTLAVLQALLGFTSEARWLRHARAHLRHLFPYLPGQPGYNKRLRRLAGTVSWLIGVLARDTSWWSDDVWVIDSTPVECARSRETVRRSDLAGWAQYGYCASHSRYFWGLRLHMLATLPGLPIAFALTGAKADERQVLLDILAADPNLASGRPGRSSSATSTITAVTSRPTWQPPGSACCGPPARANPPGPAHGSSNPYGRPSSRSSTATRASPAWNATVARRHKESWSGSFSASWH